MIRILRDKFVRLGRDEDGAALIVTLALFMFMYLSCAGVFAVGQQVKDRIHLQNACDAAAYSAAVVQADTLSRIATINRAMAWTYISMSKRQMDYIVDRWLAKTVEAVRRDVEEARGSHGDGLHEDPDHKRYWDLRGDVPTFPRLGRNNDEDDTYISLNWNPETDVDLIKDKIADFESNWYKSDSSFYNGAGSGINVLGRQIDADKDTLNMMHEKEKELANLLPGRIDTAAKSILQANALPGRDLRYCVMQCQTPYAGGGYEESYLEIPDSSDEIRFLAFADYYPATSSMPFDTGSGSGQWFPRSTGKGFLRKYRQRTEALVAHWFWRTWRWICDPVDPTKCHFVINAPHENECKGADAYDARFDGVAARPLILTQDYFGAAGTITIGLACYNENPWYRMFRNSAGIAKGILGGIYGAFNPYKNIDWTWTFSSAKAGYKFKGGIISDSAYKSIADGIDSRSYMVHWDGKKANQKWNLCQSDWDAVFVPVRRAASSATGSGDPGSWSLESAPLDEWINGEWEPLGSGSWGVVASMPDLPGMHDSGGAGGLKWKALADMLYH